MGKEAKEKWKKEEEARVEKSKMKSYESSMTASQMRKLIPSSRFV